MNRSDAPRDGYGHRSVDLAETAPGLDSPVLQFASITEAMADADLVVLRDVLDDSFTLTHMTGYLQPKDEWLADIDADEMQYHSIDVVETAVRSDGADTVVHARTVTEATIWEMHGTWRLQLRTAFSNAGGRWVATSMVASTW